MINHRSHMVFMYVKWMMCAIKPYKIIKEPIICSPQNYQYFISTISFKFCSFRIGDLDSDWKIKQSRIDDNKLLNETFNMKRNHFKNISRSLQTLTGWKGQTCKMQRLCESNLRWAFYRTIRHSIEKYSCTLHAVLCTRTNT